MSYDRLLRYVFDDIDKRLRPASYIIRERSDAERTQVVAANGRGAAHAMFDLLDQLPSAVGAGSDLAFVVGFAPIDRTLMPDEAREAIASWQGWKHFFFAGAVDFRLDDGPADAQLAFASRFTEIVTKELASFITPRLIFWKPDLEDRRWR